MKKLVILSRKSDLAVIQAHEFGEVLLSKYPSLKINYITKSTSGDIDLKTPLSQMPSEGVFTNDLRDELIKKNCDLIIHSWKDLPLDVGNQTEVAITLDRADPRDLLFIKKNSIQKINQNSSISIFSSSPRRQYNLESFVKNYLPFHIKNITFENIRGNILTRFKKFLDGNVDAFVVAKAAIDRLLNANQNDFPNLRNNLFLHISECLWNVIPLSVNPSSPGQGALAVEIRSEDTDLKNLLSELNNEADYANVILERKELQKYGGGCHQKIGVSFLNTHFGKVKYSKGEAENGSAFYEKIIYKNHNLLSVKAKSSDEIFPAEQSDYNFFNRVEIEDSNKKLSELKDKCIWISRESALPKNTNIDSSNIIWVSGLETWKNIAKRGIWVNGSSDGLGEDIECNIQHLTQNEWIKLTHLDAPPSKIKKTISTYKLEKNKIFDNLDNKTYFYWMSSSAFKLALTEFPSISEKFHFCGPGNTYNEIKNILGKDSKNLFIELSYKDWKSNILS
tara:strand:- start:45 stop:1565 length:1521 start_codon:yes stop_codon:yes gene_type:complete